MSIFKTLSLILCTVFTLQSSTTCSAKILQNGLTHPQLNAVSKHLEQATYSGEIWSRVRQNLEITTPSSKDLFKQHANRYSRSQSYLNHLVNNASPYLYFVMEEVEKRGMPSELALLPMIESEFNPNTVSHKGAVGLWQLMPVLARIHGLTSNSWYEGRKDIYESTKVALDHLQYLHKKFHGNWLHAIAAYNSGETKVLNAIKKNQLEKKSTDFWSLNLPTETKHFVPKLLALAAIVKSPKQYGVVLPSIPNKPVFARINTGRALDIAHVAKMVDISESQLKKLNPGLQKTAMSPNGPHHLVVPVNHVASLERQIKTNKTLSAVASTKSSKDIKKADKAPVQFAKSKNKTQLADVKVAETSKSKIHVVKKGDTIPKISKKYNVKIDTLLNNNKIKSNMRIYPGQKIVLSKG